MRGPVGSAGAGGNSGSTTAGAATTTGSDADVAARLSTAGGAANIATGGGGGGGAESPAGPGDSATHSTIARGTSTAAEIAAILCGTSTVHAPLLAAPCAAKSDIAM